MGHGPCGGSVCTAAFGVTCRALGSSVLARRLSPDAPGRRWRCPCPWGSCPALRGGCSAPGARLGSVTATSPGARRLGFQTAAPLAAYCVSRCLQLPRGRADGWDQVAPETQGASGSRGLLMALEEGAQRLFSTVSGLSQLLQHRSGNGDSRPRPCCRRLGCFPSAWPVSSHRHHHQLLALPVAK